MKCAGIVSLVPKKQKYKVRKNSQHEMRQSQTFHLCNSRLVPIDKNEAVKKELHCVMAYNALHIPLSVVMKLNRKVLLLPMPQAQKTTSF